VMIEMMIPAEDLNNAGAFQPVVNRKKSAKPSPPKQQPSHQPQTDFGDLLQSRRERYIDHQARAVRPKTTRNGGAALNNAATAAAATAAAAAAAPTSTWQPGCGLQCANIG